MSTLPRCFENYFLNKLASQFNNYYSRRFAVNKNWSAPQFKKPAFNVQADIKALNCEMGFLQKKEIIISEVMLSLLID